MSIIIYRESLICEEVGEQCMSSTYWHITLEASPIQKQTSGVPTIQNNILDKQDSDTM